MGIHIPVFVLTSPNQQSTVVFNFSLQQIKYTEQHGATHNYPCGASHPRDHRKSIVCHRGVQGRLYGKRRSREEMSRYMRLHRRVLCLWTSARLTVTRNVKLTFRQTRVNVQSYALWSLPLATNKCAQ